MGTSGAWRSGPLVEALLLEGLPAGYLSDVDKEIATDLIGAYRAVLLDGGSPEQLQTLAHKHANNAAELLASVDEESGEVDELTGAVLKTAAVVQKGHAAASGSMMALFE